MECRHSELKQTLNMIIRNWCRGFVLISLAAASVQPISAQVKVSSGEVEALKERFEEEDVVALKMERTISFKIHPLESA